MNYVTNLSDRYERPMLEVGMRHIQFAVEEKNLLRHCPMPIWESCI